MLDAAQCAALKQYFAARENGGYADLSPGDFVFKMTGRVLLDKIHWEVSGSGRYNFNTDCGLRVDWWDDVDQSDVRPMGVTAYRCDVDDKMYYTASSRAHVTCPGCK